MMIPGATAVLVQPMLRGMELFAGVMKNEKFGHLVLCGLGGIFVETLKDVQAGLAPFSHEEALDMIRNLKAYKMLTGVRGKEDINVDQFADILTSLSMLVTIVPEIAEMDLNPLLATTKGIIAVDSRIRIAK
jgi:acetyltransferase